MYKSVSMSTMALDQATLAKLRAKLEDEKMRIETDLEKIAEKTSDGSFAAKFPEDIGDRVDENATEVEEFTDNIAIGDTLEAQRKEVDDALAKMDSGTYGICEKTGKEIPLARLETYPAARTVVDV